MMRFLLIALGATLGANARYWMGVWAGSRFGADFPYGTFLVNITGCFLIGLFFGFGETRFTISGEQRLFFVVGFLGSYTTFSSFGYESINLLRSGNLWLAGLNIMLTLVFGLPAVVLGLQVARWLA
jgi:CrcB protein